MNSIGPVKSISPRLLLIPLLSCALMHQSSRSEGGRGAIFGSEQDPSKQSAGARTDEDPHHGFTLTGIVVREDGTPPPFGVVVECDCGRGYKKEGEADASGFFSFQIRPMSESYPSSNNAENGPGSLDANRAKHPSVTTAPSPWSSAIDLHACQLRARISGYRSSIVRLGREMDSYTIDVGNIVLSPIGRVPGTSVSVTSLHAPRTALKAMERAQHAFGEQKFDEAEKALRAALAAYPKYAEAWFWLGWLHEQRRRYQESRAAYEKAVALDGNHARPYVGLAQIAGLEQRWQEAADFSERALALEPLHFPEAYFLNALAYYKMNDLETAERSARKGQLMDAGHRIPKIHLLLADILFQKNDLTGSLQAMQQYLDLAPDAPDAEAVRALLHRRAMHP